MAHLGDNTKQRSVYFCLSLVLARVVKRVEATSTSTYCVWHFSCCRSYMIFYSSCNFNTFLKICFLVYFLPIFGRKDLICHIYFFVTRDKKCAYWTLVPLSLPLSLSFFVFLSVFFPSVSNFLKAMYQYCVFTSSVMFIFNLCNRG